MLKTGFKAFIQIPSKSALSCPNMRFFGVLQRYQENRTQKEYKEFLNFMTSRDQFTLVEYKQFIAESVEKATKGFVSKMFGGDEQSKAELLESKTLLNACLVDELRNPNVLRNEAIQEEIEQVSQVPKDKIHKLLRTFEGFRSLHRYINMQKKEGKPFPPNFDDLTRKFKTEYTPSFEEKKAMYIKRDEMMEERRKDERKSYIDMKILNKRIRTRPYRT